MTKSIFIPFVEKYLSIKPAGLNAEEMQLFFNQHVALECIYHLNLTGFEKNIIPFLQGSKNLPRKGICSARVNGL